jgi:serine/threonine protein kinase
MGIVYKAKDLKLKRSVAIKFLSSTLTQNQESRDRFTQEAEAASALDHPNICTIYEIDQSSDDQIFMVMAYYQGQTLDRRLKLKSHTIENVLHIVIDIAEGLAAAHKHGIVHRDVKPGNVIVTEDGSVKILDFGLAKLSGQTGLTKEWTSFGTANYMSPEQAKGDLVDDRTDIWSLGVLLYEAISGRLPFMGEYEQAVIYNIINQDPHPIQEFKHGVPDELAAIITKALNKDPKERYQTVLEFISDLKNVLSNIETGSSFILPRLNRQKIKKKFHVFSIPLILMIIILIFSYIWFNYPSHVLPKSITVLPFENMSQDEDEIYFSNGITEDIIVQLSKISDLRVISFRQSIDYRNSQKSLAEIGEELNVTHLLTGSVRRADNKVRIIAKLFQRDTGEQLWAEKYDRQLSEVFKIQSEVARQIAKALEITLSNKEDRRINKVYTKDLTAYDYYLKGRNLYHRLRPIDNNTAISLFKKAIHIDPTFALAYTGLADAFVQKTLRFGAESFWLDSAVVQCQHALQIDENLAEAHKALGLIYYSHSWFDKSLNENRFALDENPNYFIAMHNMGWIYLNLGELSLARRWLERARQGDPLFSSTQMGLGLLNIYLTDYTAAIHWLNNSYDIQPDLNPNPQVALVLIDIIKNNLSEAAVKAENLVSKLSEDVGAYISAGDVALLSGDPSSALNFYQKALMISPKAWHPFTGINATTSLGFIFKKTNHISEATEMINYSLRLDKSTLEQGSQWWGIAYDMAAIYAINEEYDMCFQWLDKTLNAGFLFYSWLEIDPLFESVRDDPRFSRFIEKIKLQVDKQRD